MERRNGKKTCVVFAVCVAAVSASRAQTLTTLGNFDATNGGLPQSSLVQGLDGNFYGTGDSGFEMVSDQWGTLFKITPGGTLTTIYTFCLTGICTNGAFPYAGLVVGTDGFYYGTTYWGGASNAGTVFKIIPGGTLKTLYSFCAAPNCTDGAFPDAALVQGANGDFYGTTTSGGTNSCVYDGNASGCGTVFKISTGGALTTVYNFAGTDGATPTSALILGTDGNFYGTTSLGGPHLCNYPAPGDDGGYVTAGCGTVFKLTSAGALTTLHNFSASEGYGPTAGLVEGTNRHFYGTAFYGGAGVGTVFEISPGGASTTLHTFCTVSNCTDGQNPYAGLVQGTDGNFYGTTEFGEPYECSPGTPGEGCGTAFQITPGGVLTTLHTFVDGTDGANPVGGLVQGTDGNFYGTTEWGGTGSWGTVFSLSVGLGPFVEALPVFGKAGTPVKILGTNLTGAASVTFNGKAAAFTVVGPSLIKTTVPAGATSGMVQVTIGSETLSSNVPFRVRP